MADSYLGPPNPWMEELQHCDSLQCRIYSRLGEEFSLLVKLFEMKLVPVFIKSDL